jgi:glutamate synthase (NADPH/NADH) small chain
MENMRQQAINVGADIRSGSVTDVDFETIPYKVTFDDGAVIEADSVIVATGAAAKYLGLADEIKYQGMGVSACATCDGFFYRKKIVAVVGGGNVAMDAARTALRLGANKVYIVYRRGMEELPARKEEVEHAIEEGIEFKLLNNPIEIIGYNNPDDRRDPKNGFVKAMKCVRMELSEPDESGRRRPVEVPNSEFTLDVDAVIMSIGTSPNPLIKSTTVGLEINKWGGIIVEETTNKTSLDGVYAGGDAVTGAATVISAMGAGKVAGQAIDEYLKNK